MPGLLSGFTVLFRGGGARARTAGSATPVTRFLRVRRGSLLKGSGVAEGWPNLTAFMVFVVVVTGLAMAATGPPWINT